MDPQVLKIDLDCRTKSKAIAILKERLAYCHDLNFFHAKQIVRVELIKKSSYGARIRLNTGWKPEWIVILQLILGSDWQKEVNTLINHFKLEMEYSNRLFTVKRYKEGVILGAEVTDVTEMIFRHVYNNHRHLNKN